jgi:hypothetical protein
VDSKEGEVMDIKKLTQILIDLGEVIIVGAILWCATSYGQLGIRMNLEDFIKCLYTFSGSYYGSYNPILFWIGIIMYGAGKILKASLKKDGTP